MNGKQFKNDIDSIHLKAKSVTIDGVRYTNQHGTWQTTNPDSRNLNLGIPSTVNNNTPSISLLKKNLEHLTTKSNDESTSKIKIGSLKPFKTMLNCKTNNICKLPSFTNSFKTASSNSFEALVNTTNFENSSLPVEEHQFIPSEFLLPTEIPEVNLQSELVNNAHVNKITTQGFVDQNSISISSCSKKQTFKIPVFDDKSPPEASCNLLDSRQNVVNSKSKMHWHNVFKKNYSNNNNTRVGNKLIKSELLKKINLSNALQQNGDNLSNTFQPLLLNQGNNTTQHSSKNTPYIFLDSSATDTTDVLLTNKVTTNEIKKQHLNCETSNASNLTENVFYQKQLTENCPSHKINVNELNKNNSLNKLKISHEQLQLKNTQINIQSARQIETKKETKELDFCLNEIDDKWGNKRKRDDEAIELCINNEIQSEMKKIKIAADNVPFKSGSFIEKNKEQIKKLKNNPEITIINVHSYETLPTLIYKPNNDGEVSTSKQLIQSKNTTVPDHKAGPFNISAKDNNNLSKNIFFKVNNEKIQNKTNIGRNERSQNPASQINKKHVSNSDYLTFGSRKTNPKLSITILDESPVKKIKYNNKIRNELSLIKTRKEILLEAYNKLCDNENFMKIKKQIADILQKGYNIRKPLLGLQNIEIKINSGDILDFSNLENEILFVISNAIMYKRTSSPVHEMALNLRLEIKNYFQLLQDEIDINEFDQIEKQTKTTNTEELNFNYRDFNFDCKYGILHSLNEWIDNSSDESSAENSDERPAEDSDEDSAEDSNEISIG